jgi:hypothetical protein
MAQHDFNIANQSFPSFRTDLNNALSAINTSQSGTSRPSGAVAGTIWLDTTSATSPTLKYYDGADDISLATLDHSANTVNWLDSTVSITGLSTTATGTVLTLTDSASTSTVNLIIDNQKEIRFRETTANGTNYIGLKAPASVTADLTFTLPVAPTVNNQALISTTAGVMAFTPYTFPTSDGTASQVLQTNGSGVLSFATPSSGTNTPAFYATSSPLATSVVNATLVKMQFNTESFDTDNCYDTSNFRFTPNVAGKYVINVNLRNFQTSDYNDMGTVIAKNGSIFININNSSQHNESNNFSAIVTANGTTDYFEIFHEQASGSTVNAEGYEFSGYRLIGV